MHTNQRRNQAPLRFGPAEIPKSKRQAPEKIQASNPKWRRETAVLDLGIWGFFAVWSLVLGVFIGGSLKGLKRLKR